MIWIGSTTAAAISKSLPQRGQRETSIAKTHFKIRVQLPVLAKTIRAGPVQHSWTELMRTYILRSMLARSQSRSLPAMRTVE